MPSITTAAQARNLHSFEDLLDVLLDGPIETEPIDWPDEVPEAYRPDAFRGIVQKVLADCAIRAELVRVDCDEPPCIAVLRFPDEPGQNESLGDCPLWAEKYGTRTAINQTHKVMPCADGSVERAAFVYRFWPAIYQQHLARMTRRQHQRVRELRDGWQCAP
jgi:hypothetical protein